MAKELSSSATNLQTSNHRVFLNQGDRIEARSQVDGRLLNQTIDAGTVEDIALVDGCLWVSARVHRRLRVSEYTRTLQYVEQIPLGIAAPADAPQGHMAPAPDGRSVLVSNGTRVLIVAAASRRVAPVRFASPPGEIDDLAWLSTAPDRFAVGHRSERGGQLFVYGLADGTASSIAHANLGFSQVESGGNQGVAGSPARVYLVIGLGHAVPVDTFKVRHGKMIAVGTDGDLMQYAEVDYSDHQLWIGGFDRLACADPRTGQESASTRLTAIAKQSEVTTLATSHGNVYALIAYGGHGHVAMVSIKPPPACR